MGIVNSVVSWVQAAKARRPSTKEKIVVRITNIFTLYLIMSLMAFTISMVTYESGFVSDSNFLMESYSSFQTAAREGDGEKAVSSFLRLKYSTIGIADFLSALVGESAIESSVKSANASYQEGDYRLSPETWSLLLSLAKSNTEAGHDAEMRRLDASLICMRYDVVCIMARDYIKNNYVLTNIKLLQHRSSLHIYNILHPQEFLAWRQQLHKQILSKTYPLPKSPGEVALGD